MDASERLFFSSVVDGVKLLRTEDPGRELSAKQRSLLLAVDHIQAIERRNENLSELYRKSSNILESVMKFMTSLRQAYAVARTGVLVGEVKALGTTLRDLQRALGLEPDKDEDEN